MCVWKAMVLMSKPGLLLTVVGRLVYRHGSNACVGTRRNRL